MRLVRLLHLFVPCNALYFLWLSNVNIGSRMQCNPTPKECPNGLLAYRREALSCAYESCLAATRSPNNKPTITPPTTQQNLLINAYTAPPTPTKLHRPPQYTLNL
ncbi:hypothetical protein THRCLA_21985 [Thraustotheca clavata]|uniref:Secreted protein n=1 Tax=Thraustotheca clavata TaxID=74557 RepID=A0A1V9ZFR4_9STRA|nr:hypothetical protein THRCLA_21985 [Thraustotheca clavata]